MLFPIPVRAYRANIDSSRVLEAYMKPMDFKQMEHGRSRAGSHSLQQRTMRSAATQLITSSVTLSTPSVHTSCTLCTCCCRCCTCI